MGDRITYDDDGEIDEISAGGAYLERMDKNRWFLSMARIDGSQVCVWLKGSVMEIEERPNNTGASVSHENSNAAY